MRPSPLITVLVPVYNGDKYLQESLDSIARQTFRDFEVLLLDDGSTDKSPKIMRDFAENHDRVTIVRKSNTGLTDTLNTGLGHARGEWIVRLDQDDVSEPIRFEMQIGKIMQNKSLVLLGSNFQILDQYSRKTRKINLPTKHNELVRRLERLKGFFPHSSAIYHKDTALSIGGYDQSAKFNEDWDLWLRLSEVGQIGSVAKCLVTIRKHSLQMTENSGPVSPQGEAFLSSTFHFLRINTHSALANIENSKEEVRKMIEGTEQFKKYCQVILLQQELRLMRNKKYSLWLCSQMITRSNLIVRLIYYRWIGTSAPSLVSKRCLMVVYNRSKLED